MRTRIGYHHMHYGRNVVVAADPPTYHVASDFGTLVLRRMLPNQFDGHIASWTCRGVEYRIDITVSKGDDGAWQSSTPTLTRAGSDKGATKSAMIDVSPLQAHAEEQASMLDHEPFYLERRASVIRTLISELQKVEWRVRKALGDAEYTMARIQDYPKGVLENLNAELAAKEKVLGMALAAKQTAVETVYRFVCPFVDPVAVMEEVEAIVDNEKSADQVLMEMWSPDWNKEYRQ